MVFGEAITPGEVEDRLKDTLVSYIAITFPADSPLDLIIAVRSPIFTFEPLIRRCQRTPRGERRTTPWVRRQR
jgi:hypothetical protein